MIGIVSNFDDIDTVPHLLCSNKHKIYIWWIGEGVYYGTKVLTKRVGWKSGDEITVVLNAKDWTLIFSKNGANPKFDPLSLEELN